MKKKLSILFLGLIFCGATTAQAQFSVTGDGPSNVTADSVDYRPDVTILSGQVDFRQGQTRILSDTMKIYSGGEGLGSSALDEVSRIEATGNFYYITPEQEVRGNRGVYERSKDSFTVSGDVILLQGKDSVVTGDRLVYNLTTNEAKVIGTCK